jgi:hypothetical protein
MPRRRSDATRMRDAEAFALRRRGLSHRQISAQMGWKSPASAVDAVNRALAETYREDVAKWREMEIDKLDDYTRIVLEGMAKPHYMVSQGKLVRDEATGEPVIDYAKPWEGVDRLVKIAERRARLIGCDAPQQAKVTVQDNLDQEIQRLVDELAHSAGDTKIPAELPAAPEPAS